MKICLITVYNSYNYGSYLQAYALMNVLKSYGEVFLLNTKARSLLKPSFYNLASSIYRLSLKRFLVALRKSTGFLLAIRLFPIIKFKQLNKINFDCFLFGSDEIWNISRDDFSKYPIFWGAGIISKNKVAYAPSINNTTPELMQTSEFANNCISEFRNISVRDLYTQTVLQKYYCKPIPVVADPTLLLNQSFYMAIEKHHKLPPYIFVYVLHELPMDIIKQIKDFALEHNLITIGCGRFLDWCDKNVGGSPFDFLGYIHQAEFVFANTFHGTAFSIIFEKQFAVYESNSKKLNNLLNYFELEQRNSAISQISLMFKNPIDYSKVNLLRQALNDTSFEYIRSIFTEF